MNSTYGSAVVVLMLTIIGMTWMVLMVVRLS